MSRAASKDKMKELHAKLAEILTEAIYEKDDEGKRSAAILNVARQFLKDNTIESEIVKSPALGKLSQALDDVELPDQTF
jgi:hypothetical protein